MANINEMSQKLLRKIKLKEMGVKKKGQAR